MYGRGVGGLLSWLWLCGLVVQPASGAEPISFARDIRPILEARCLKCHGASMQAGRLDLRSRASALKGGERGPVIKPGDPGQSALFRRVAGLEKPAMPIDGPLARPQVELIRRWIEAGAPWEGEIQSSMPQPPANQIKVPELPSAARSFWAFRTPVRPQIPTVSDPRWSAHPIDAFLKKEWDARGLIPAPAADRVTLVRRAYLDLLGLPPAPEQIDQFLRDPSPEAWPKLIDKLLASPHYGERWGRHWLDVARYADSSGYEHDYDRPNAWRYRDYVIRSFNRDTPFDRFLLEQIAGDELEDESTETLIATGFLRNYAKVGFREKDNPQFRFDYLDDMIATLGRGVMGLTLHCARCHDHKFDPIFQYDYYRLQASLFSYVEVDHPLVPRAEAEAYSAKLEEIARRIQPLQARIREIESPYREALLQEKYKKFPPHIQEAINTPEHRRTPGQVLLANQIIRTTSVSSAEFDRVLKPAELAEKKRLQEAIRALEQQKPPPIPSAMGITDGDYRFAPDGPGDEPAPGKGVKQEAIEGSFLHRGPGRYQPPPAYFLHHGDMQSRGPEMRPGFPLVLTRGNPAVELPPAHGRTSGRRLALAKWLVSPDHPLTTRVIVNRIWHHHFGRGIVGTLDNFGHTGDRPTHPELLDWLALEFQQSGWSMKRLHKLIMTSAAYQMSSAFAPESNLAKDAANLYLWRFRPQRLEAEVIRDSILAVSGALNPALEGPPIFPKLAGDVLKSMRNGIWQTQPEGPQTWRRSIYVYRKRGLPFPFFEVFDLPDQSLTCSRRNVSTVATQALTLLNNEFVVEQSRRFAERVRRLSADPSEQLVLAYRLAVGRVPDATERALGLRFLESNSLEDFTHVLFNLSEFVYLR
ncbi:MAG: PSD1 and planctomycete cytochrome C domain-containing protein [Bryobacteraceae bacterium]|nr:PSD1 and planctomycete cytochrome C domain-containing protein [Bryobacteraceae bacterium]MDW8378051.1 PSD1 and planctomycete cytochrome C domain-containing protein [Bryobacterales bacterium]